MKMAVFGTGMVGNAIGAKLVSLGHDVTMGSRTATNEKAVAWAKQHKARAGTFADANAGADMVWNCTGGLVSIAALTSAGSLDGKLLVDISNPLDFSRGMPPTLGVVNDDSIGERIQRAFPQAKVVKTLNTVNCAVMVDAARVNGGDHTMFMCGDDVDAKAQVKRILSDDFGWKDVLDLGDIKASRGMEMYLPLWLRMYGALKIGDFNVKVVR